MQRIKEKGKTLTRNKKLLIGLAVLLLTVCYLTITVAIAQEASVLTSKTQITYNRDPLSWGDVWAFGSAEYNASKYANQNASATYKYYTTSQDTTSSTAPSTTSYNGYKYYGTVTTADKQGITSGTALTTYTVDKFYNSSVTTGTMAAPIGLEGVNVPVASIDSGTGVYSVVPDKTGSYRFYVYSPSGNPSSKAHYALLETCQTNNSYSSQMGTARTFTRVGSTDWYYTELTVTNLSWSAYALSVAQDKSSNSNTTSANDTGTGTTAGKVYTSLGGGGTTYYHFYNKWTYTEHVYNTVLAVQFDSSVKLGPFTRSADTLTINSGSDGTISAYDPFGTPFTTNAAYYHMPVFFTATPSGAAQFAGFTDSSDNPMAVETYEKNNTKYYGYIFESTATLNATWEVMIDFPVVNVTGGATATAHYYLNKAGKASFTYGEPTDFTFSADYTDAVNSPISYTAVANGATVASGSLSSTGDSFSVTAQWYQVVVTFSSTYDGVTRTMTFTLDPSTSGLTPVAKIGSTNYYTLEDALTVSASGNSVILLTNYTFYTDDNPKTEWGAVGTGAGYTVKSGVSLVIPYSASGTSIKSSSDKHPYACETQVTSTTATATAVSASVYVELTVPENYAINVLGTMAVGGTTNGVDQILGAHANVKLEKNAVINVQSTGILSACGYIYGEGTVNTVNGSKIYMPFSVLDFRGGGYTVAVAGRLGGSSYGISSHPSGETGLSPFTRYCMIAIQSKLVINKGATVYGYVDLYADSDHNNSCAVIIGSDGGILKMMSTAADSKVVITYDESTYVSTNSTLGKSTLAVYGDAQLNNFQLKVSAAGQNVTVNTNECNFLIPYNYDIEICSGTFSVPYSVILLPGASVHLHEGAMMNVSNSVTIYDGLHDYTSSGGGGNGKSEYLQSVLSGYTSPAGYTTKVSPSNNYPTTAVLMAAPFYGSGSADLVVDGTLNLNSGTKIGGVIQTGSSGAARIVAASGITTSTTTQLGATGTWELNVIIRDYYYGYAGATVRTLKGQVLDTATGVRTDLAPGKTYKPSAGADKLTSYTYTLYIDSAQNALDPITESVNCVLKGSWYNYEVTVHMIDETTGASLGDSTMLFAHGADVTGRGYYSDAACTTPVTSVTSAADLYYKGTAEAKIVWATGGDDSYFTTLRAAVKSVRNNGDRVVLLVNKEGFSEIIGPAADQDFIVDLNGKTVSYTGIPFASNSGGKLTIDLNCGTLTNKVGDTYYYYPPVAPISEGSELVLDLNGGTIDLLGDGSATGVANCMVDNGGDLTVDLNGGTWNLTTGFTAANAAFNGKAVISNSGTLTVQDSTGGGKLTTDAISNASGASGSAVVRNNTGATLTVNGHASDDMLALSQTQNVNGNNYGIYNLGTITELKYADITTKNSGTCGLNLYNYNTGVISKITGGHMFCNVNCAIFNYGGTITTIDGLTIDGKNGITNRNLRTGALASGYIVTDADKGIISTIQNCHIEVGQYAIANHAVINTVSGSTLIAHPDTAQVDTRGNGLATASEGNVAAYTVYNSYNWWYDTNVWKRVDSSSGGYTRSDYYKEEEPYRPTIGTITNCEIYAENTTTSASYGDYPVVNYGVIGTIGGTTNIKTYKHTDNAYSGFSTSHYGLHNLGGGIIKSIEGTVNVSATGIGTVYNDGVFTTQINYTYGNKVGGNVTHQESTYGDPSTIRSITCAGTWSCGSYYCLMNSGYIGTINAPNLTLKGNTSSYNVLYNTTGGVNSSYVYDCDYTDVATAATAYHRHAVYTKNLTKGSTIGTLSGITVQGKYQVLNNQGHVGTLSNVTVTNNSSSNDPTFLNGDSRYATVIEDRKNVASYAEDNPHVTISAGYATRYDRDYTYDTPTIDTIDNLTVNSTGQYAFRNAGHIGTLKNSNLTASTNYALHNSASGPYTERQTLQYYSGTSVFATTKYPSEYSKHYKRGTATIDTIDNCNIKTTSSTYAALNVGHIGTIKNSTFQAGATTFYQYALANLNSQEREYTRDGLEDIMYITANGGTACTAYFGTGGETDVVVYDYDQPTIDLIGEGNTFKATTTVIANQGVITAINSGTGTPTTITGSAQKGSAIYNYSACLDARTTTTPYTAAASTPASGTKGTATNSDTLLSGAQIGTIKNVFINANGYGVLNGDASAGKLPTISEIGEGTEIYAHCTTAGYHAIYNQANAKITKISGGLYKATKATTNAYKNNSTTAANATLISGGDFQGNANNRTNAIFEPDNTNRQTYPSGKKLSIGTEDPTETNANMSGNYYYIADSYTVTFNMQNHGTAPANQTVESGQKATAPTGFTSGTTTVTESGATYRFDGWYQEAACNNAWNFTSDTVIANTELFAKWTQVFTVTFNANGHGTAPDSQTVESGQKATEPTAPTATGYTFGGWYKEAACTNVWNFTSDTVTANTTIYAKWTALYTVTFNVQEHGTVPTAQTIESGQKATAPSGFTSGTTTVTESGATYRFDGWYQEAACNNAWNFTSDTVTANTTIYAKWTALYTVTFDANGHGTSPSALTNVEHGSKITAPTAPTEDNWDFEGWYKEADCTNVWDFSTDTVTSNTTLYANWSRSTCRITWVLGTGTETTDVPYGSDLTSTANTYAVRYVDGFYTYSFTGWDATPSTNVTADATYTAQYEVSEVSPFDFFTRHSLSLNGSIGVNFYLELPEGGLNPTDYTYDISFYKADECITGAQLTADNATGNLNEYKISFPVDAPEMTDEITATLYFKGTQVDTDSYKTVNYADTFDSLTGTTVVPGNTDTELEDGAYYLVGTIMGKDCWQDHINLQYKMTQNPSNTNEYMLQHVELQAGDKIKVIQYHEGGSLGWYPDGTGNEYVVGTYYGTEGCGTGTFTVYMNPTNDDNTNTTWDGRSGKKIYVAPETSSLDLRTSLLRAMHNYGSKAQVNFKHNTTDLADLTTYIKSPNSFAEVTNDMINAKLGTDGPRDTSASEYKNAFSSHGLTYAGHTLVMNSNTRMRFYFTFSDGFDLDNFNNTTNFTIDGASVNAVWGNKSQTMIYFEVSGIEAANLDHAYTLSDGTNSIAYSALDYVRLTLNQGTNLKNLGQALFWYNYYADLYFDAVAREQQQG